MKTITIHRHKEQYGWRYDVPGAGFGVDSRTSDAETERAIVAVIRSRMNVPQDTAFEIVDV